MKIRLNHLKNEKKELEIFIEESEKERDKFKVEENIEESEELHNLEAKLIELQQEVLKIKESSNSKAEILQSLETSHTMLLERNVTLEKELQRLKSLEDGMKDKEENKEQNLEDQISDLGERLGRLVRNYTVQNKPTHSNP